MKPGTLNPSRAEIESAKDLIQSVTGVRVTDELARDALAGPRIDFDEAVRQLLIARAENR